MFNGITQRGELPAPWNEHANDDERDRLAVLEERIKRKQATIEELLAERKRIMRRCIARMRKKEGKR